MAIHAQMHDGTILEFPDNTSQDVIDKTAQGYIAGLGKPQEGKKEEAAKPQAEVAPQKSLSSPDVREELGMAPLSLKPAAPSITPMSLEDMGMDVSKMPTQEQRVKEFYTPGKDAGILETAGKYTLGSLQKGATELKKTIGSSVLYAEEALGMKESAAETKSILEQFSKVSGAIGTPENYAGKIVHGAGSSIVQQLPLLFGGSLAGKAPVLSNMFAQSFFNTYGDSREKGLDITDSNTRAATYATAEVIGESLGIGETIKAIKSTMKGAPVSEVVSHYAKALIKEIPGEQLTYLAQFAADKGYGLNPEAGLKEFLLGSMDTFFSTIAQGGMMMGAGAGATKAVNAVGRIAEKSEEKTRAAEDETLYKNAMDNVLRAKGFTFERPQKTTSTQSAFEEADTYDENRRTIPGANKPSVSLPDEESRADTGVAGAGLGRLERTGDTTRNVGVREEAISNQLNELYAQQDKIAKFDPTDPRVGEIDETIKELKAELKDIQQAAPITPATTTTQSTLAPNKNAYETAKSGDFSAGFPIMLSGYGNGTVVPYSLVQKAEAQLLKNHGNQSLTTLAQRGGITEGELLSALEGKGFGANMNLSDEEISQKIANYVAEETGAEKQQTALNAPGAEQQGFEFGTADETTQRSLGTPADEFQLTAPAGSTGVTTEAAPVEEKTDTAKMMLVGGGNNPLAPANSFFNSLKPESTNPAEQNRYKGEVKKLLSDINDFVEGLVDNPQELSLRLSTLRNFFDDLSIAPLEKENLTSTLSQRMAGLSSADQANILGNLTSLGKLNTRRGVEELRNKLEQTLVDYERKRIGQPLETAAIPYNMDEALSDMNTYVALRIVKALRALKSIPAKERTPQENAAHAYFSVTDGAEYGWSYALGMRSAAFDLGAKTNPTYSSPIFKGQNHDQAKLFKEWVEENLPNQESKRFDASVQLFTNQVKAAEMYVNGIDSRKNVRATGLADSYMRIIGHAPSGKEGKFTFGAGLGKLKKPSEGKKLSPLRFYPMHPAIQARIANNDLNGALKIMERSGSPFQNALAARLRELNLKTSIVFDKQDSHALTILNANVKAQQDLVFNDIMAKVYPDIHAEYFSDLNNVRKVNAGLQAIKDGKVQVNTDSFVGQFNDLVEQYQNAVGIMDASGTYMPHLDAINLNRARGGASNWSFLHEVTHAGTQYALDPANFDKLTPKQQKAVVELQKLYDFAKRTGLNEYGFTSLPEFVAEAFSNEQFQKLLQSLPYQGDTAGFTAQAELAKKDKSFAEAYNKAKAEGKTSIVWNNTEYAVGFETATKQTLWDKFTRAVMKLFGKDNVLTHTLANANTILQATPAMSDASIAINNRGWSNSSVLGNKAPNTVPAVRRFFRGIDNMMEHVPGWDSSKGAVERFLKNTTNETRKYYLNGFTLRQLDDIIGHQLPQFKEFIKTAENMLDDRNKTLEDVKDISIKWKNIIDNKEQQAKQMSDLMIDATLAKVDPDVNKSDMLLNQRWDALDDDVKQLYREVRDFYKDRMADYVNIVLENKKDSLRGRGFSEEEIGAHDELKRKFHARARIPVNVEQLLSKGYTENEILAHQELQKLEDFFMRHKIEPYFPIRRFGQFSLNVKGKGVEREFSLYESAKERDAAMDAKVRELRNRGLDMSQVSIVPRNSLQEAFSTDLQDLEFLKELKDLVKNEQGTTVPEVKQNLDEALEQLYYMLLPDKSFQKSFISRKGTPGMSRDMLRSFATSAFHMSYQHSRFKSSRRFHELLRSADSRITEMEDSVNELAMKSPEVQKIYDTSEGKSPSQVNKEVNAAADKVAARERQNVLANRDYLANLQNVRLKNLMNPPDTGSVNNFFSSLGFVWYLSAPASAIVEMGAAASMGLPIVGARFGYAQTAAAMTGYSAKFIANTRFKDADGNWQTPSLTNMPGTLNDLQKRAYDLLASEGLFDFTLMHDIRNMRDKQDGLVDNLASKTMKAVSTPFHVAGKFNREIVGMATFDLAYDRYINKGYSEQAAFRKAVDDAKKLTYKALFDYSEVNTSPLFQNKYIKPLLMFKKFSQESMMLMFRSLHEWTWREFSRDELHDIRYDIVADHRQNKPGLPPLTDSQIDAAVKDYIKTYRSEARKQFIGIFGVSATFFAGVTGTPFWDVYKLFGNMYHWLFGDDDEPYDVENEFKNWCNEKFGSFVGNSISTGIASQLTKVDLHSRMSMAPTDLLFRDVRPGKDATQTMMNTVFMLAGPLGGFATDMTRAYDLFKQGHTQRAIETALPASVKSYFKAYRLATEGAKNVNGVKLIESFTPYEIAAQAVGFSPERLSRAQKANMEMKAMEQEIIQKRASLMSAYYLAIQTDDSKAEDKVLDKMDKFNDANPELAITQKDLQRSIKARETAADLAEEAGGISINKKLMDKLEDKNKYGREGR